MTRFHLNFNREEALKYQLQITSELLRVNEEDLHGLQKQAENTKKMREMVTGCPDTWKPLLSLMKPTPGQVEAEKYLCFQEKIVQFLTAKKQAIVMVIEDQKDPKVKCFNFKTFNFCFKIWASQHFHEMTLVDELKKIFPKRSKKVLKDLFDKMQLSETSDGSQFQVRGLS